MMVDNVYILDNGAHTAKVELSKAAAPRIIPNCIMKAKSERRRPFIGDQVEECRDASGLFYLLPFQKGFLINWDVQKTVWDHIFSKECCYGNFSETPLIVTEPCFNFPSIQEAMSEIFFEEYECQSLLRINANCVVKEDLERSIEVLQFHDASTDNLDFVESASYVLRYMSHTFTREEDLQTILWDQNHNPLLHHSFYSDSSRSLMKSCKQLWTRKVGNLPDEQLFLELNLIPTLHSCLHEKHKRQRFLLNLAEFCNSDYLLEHENNYKPDTGKQTVQKFGCNNLASECSLSRLDSLDSTEKKRNTELRSIEQITLEEFCDSNDQPVNYSLKYFEHEPPAILYNIEQPVNFSLKYLEEMENESSECVELMMFGAGETCYAETDLDQPPDVIFSYLEREDMKHFKEGSNFSHALSFSEELKEYCVEGTPCDYSIATSLSGICSPSFVEEAKVETGKVSATLEIASCPDSNRAEVVSKKSEGMLLETPLMFSRCSSVSSLTSVGPLDDERSVVSDYSRMASGMISPSDLPDSPTQTSVPGLPDFKLHAPQKPRSVFEEKVSVFREESTPVQFSTTSSLSALSFDENPSIEIQSDLKFHEQSVVTSEAASIDGKDDEDILAACISAGMQNGKSRSAGNIKSGKCERFKKIKEFSGCIKTSEKDVSKISVPTSVSKSEVSCDVVNTFTTEDTPSNISHSTTHSDLSKLHEDSDHTDILAECIQAGMPKAWGRSKCNVKKTAKIPLKLPPPKDILLQSPDIQKTSCPLEICKTANDSLPAFKSDSALKSYRHCNLVAPDSCSAGHFKVAQETRKSPLRSPHEAKNEIKIQLSRRSSIESIKEDSNEDPVTLSELLLLEQCITSGMPKKKTR